MRRVLFIIAIAYSTSANAQDTISLSREQSIKCLTEKGYSISEKTDSIIITNPMQIYGTQGFYILIRIKILNNTIATGEYTTTHKAHYSGKFNWSPISNIRQCKLSWPVYKEFIDYCRKS